MEIDTVNKFLVSSVGDNVAIMNPPRGRLSRSDALLLAAWLVALAPDDGTEPTFQQVLTAVLSA